MRTLRTRFSWSSKLASLLTTSGSSPSIRPTCVPASRRRTAAAGGRKSENKAAQNRATRRHHAPESPASWLRLHDARDQFFRQVNPSLSAWLWSNQRRADNAAQARPTVSGLIACDNPTAPGETKAEIFQDNATSQQIDRGLAENTGPVCCYRLPCDRSLFLRRRRDGSTQDSNQRAALCPTTAPDRSGVRPT